MNKKTSTVLRLLTWSAALVALGGCGHMDRRDTGTVIGAGVGALAGSAVSDGPIGPAAGAVGGALLGRELSKPSRRGY